MKDDVYRRLCETMAKRGGRYPGRDMPEFYELARSGAGDQRQGPNSTPPLGEVPGQAVLQRDRVFLHSAYYPMETWTRTDPCCE